jgi:hypothetical protein
MRRWISVLDWLPHYRRADFPGDLIFGVSGVAILVPQSMAYAQIAHLPPVVGLYASVVPLLVYAVLGRAPQLAVGPLATISILSAVGVAKLAPDNTAQFIALPATLAVIVGIVHLAIGLGRLGFLVRFLSGFARSCSMRAASTISMRLPTTSSASSQADTVTVASHCCSSTSRTTFVVSWTRPGLPSSSARSTSSPPTPTPSCTLRGRAGG